ncbi:transport protein (mfs superfamily), tartrate transporter [Neobacillus bataviensis LMG 21833]|uniref:Transport protein (Mfs superfamily), tartrate transporter n=1 Tax=Neobacillus bataviensis LMG 21833 TaxID=1117379 RepID=K6DB95_9BACI|nr:MFS transporter [Neobacillus bataviensis]EKN65343.1 transport protein (mfs superfamily), tartrate transporter [Neobacillus bataviensis LMG 21833]
MKQAPSIDALEKITVKKTMKRILPFILLLYVVAFLDRINLGFAALQMNADLALTAETFGLLSGLFFISYFLFEVPSNLILHKVGARLWIARIMITWGIVVICTGFIQSATHLYILRFLLGAAEAGFVPGIILYLTYWFRARERGKATALFFVALPVSGLIGAPLSTWIMDNISWNGLAGWRWMFIMEGIPAVILGIVVLFYLTNKPANAKWLTEAEKTWLEGELEKERQLSAKVNKTSHTGMLKDSKLWKLSLFNIAGFIAVNALSYWMPTIIKSLSSSSTTNLQIGWLAMIPSIIAIPSILFTGWNADRTNSHKLHLGICVSVAMIGFIGCSFATTVPLMILMLSITSAGLYGISGTFYAYLTFFFSESTAPAGIALVSTLSSLGGFVGPMIMGVFNFTQAMYIIAAFLLISLITLFSLKLVKNDKQDIVDGGSVEIPN